MPMTREICKRCHRESGVGFSVPDPVWAQVAAHALQDGGNVLCLGCFTEAADGLGIEWDQDIQFWPVSLATFNLPNEPKELRPQGGPRRMPPVRAIVAIDEAGAIGLRGDLPWGRRLTGDLQRFKALTLGAVLVAGVRTTAGLPRLPCRHVVTVERPLGLRPTIVAAAEAMPGAPIWVIGGGAIYRCAIELGLVDEWHVTRVTGHRDHDVELGCLDMALSSYTRVADVKGADPDTRWEVWRR